MSGAKRSADKINTVAIVVIGICSSVLVYVVIVALQAFYMNDTSEIQMMADYGGQDTAHRSLQSEQTHNLNKAEPNKVAPGAGQTFRIPIDHAMKLVVESARADAARPANERGLFVPALGPANKATLLPTFDSAGQLVGRGVTLPADGAAPPADGEAPPADGEPPPADGEAPPVEPVPAPAPAGGDAP